MARYGRGQPHAPIYLRAPFIAVLAASTVSPIHVVSAAVARARIPSIRPQSIVYVRPNRASFVPDKLARQLTIITVAPERENTRPRGTALYVRPNRASLVPDRLPPQVRVIGLGDVRPPSVGRRTALVFLRNAAVPVVATPPPTRQPIVVTSRPRISRVEAVFLRTAAATVVTPDRLPAQPKVVQAEPRPQRKGALVYLRTAAAQIYTPPVKRLHVVSQARRGNQPRRTMGLGTPFVFMRNPTAEEVVDTGAPPSPLHVLTRVPQRSARRPDGAFVYVRPNRTSLVPDRITQQVRTILQPRERQLPPTRVLLVRNALVPPPPQPDRPTFHVVLVRRPPPPARVLVQRTALTPPPPIERLAPQLHVILVRRPPPPAHIVLERGTSVVPPKLAPQITVVGWSTERPPRIRRAAVVYVRPSRTSLVPAKLAPQFHVVLFSPGRYLLMHRGLVRIMRTPIPPSGIPGYWVLPQSGGLPGVSEISRWPGMGMEGGFPSYSDTES